MESVEKTSHALWSETTKNENVIKDQVELTKVRQSTNDKLTSRMMSEIKSRMSHDNIVNAIKKQKK